MDMRRRTLSDKMQVLGIHPRSPPLTTTKRPTPKKNLLLDLARGHVEVQLEITCLPEISPIKRAILGYALALDQLYYSGRVEGSALVLVGISSDRLPTDAGVLTEQPLEISRFQAFGLPPTPQGRIRSVRWR